jgi:hypothetical protein
LAEEEASKVAELQKERSQLEREREREGGREQKSNDVDSASNKDMKDAAAGSRDELAEAEAKLLAEAEAKIAEQGGKLTRQVEYISRLKASLSSAERERDNVRGKNEVLERQLNAANLALEAALAEAKQHKTRFDQLSLEAHSLKAASRANQAKIKEMEKEREMERDRDRDRDRDAKTSTPDPTHILDSATSPSPRVKLSMPDHASEARSRDGRDSKHGQPAAESSMQREREATSANAADPRAVDSISVPVASGGGDEDGGALGGRGRGRGRMGYAQATPTTRRLLKLQMLRLSLSPRKPRQLS